MLDFVVAEALDAGIAFADDVIRIGTERNDPVALDGGFESASRLANAAERELGSDRHGGKGARPCAPAQARPDSPAESCYIELFGRCER